MDIDVQILQQPLSVSDCNQFVQDERCGGTAIFVGNVRNETQGKSVVALDFEAYKPMALSEMEKIAIDIMREWSAFKVAMHHRTGYLRIGDIAVIIAISAPHRAAAFAGCQYGIDTLKKTVPIWKKEIFENGEVWVAAHP